MEIYFELFFSDILDKMRIEILRMDNAYYIHYNKLFAEKVIGCNREKHSKKIFSERHYFYM
ncbi:MAG: hypothetical protein ACTSXH_03640 [Promethearchaeota archaeon]